MYQELLLYARPQGTMQWEFTSDYRIVDEQRQANGQTTLVPTPRFWFAKHFCNLTPPRATALATHCDSTKVLLTAFVADSAEGERLTLHVSNSGVARQVTIQGIPARLAQLRAVITSETRSFQELDPVTVSDGSVTLPLEPRCLLTLTTMPQ
jgi:hypothetical protein